MVELKPKIWISTPFHPDAMRLAEELFDVITPKHPDAGRWPELCDAAAIKFETLDRDQVRQAQKLKVITRNGVGVDMLPLDVCREKGIVVTNIPGFNAKTVAELTVGLALSVCRRITEFDRRIRRGEYAPSISYMGRSLVGSTVGLIGQGQIAYQAARILHFGFECNILVYSPTSPAERWTAADPEKRVPIPHTRVSFDELLEQSDFVSLHCPLNEKTNKLFSTRQFEKMKQTSILLNTGRGGLIDEDALYLALKNGVIAGAGVDVLNTDPPTLKEYPDLLSLENFLVTPHAGAATEDIQLRGGIVAIQTAFEFLQGKGTNISSIV